MLLTVRELKVHIGRIEALRGVDLDVMAGKVVTLLGANGAGKSTTLKTISAVIRPFSGEIRFQGQPIHNKTPRQIVEMGIVQVPEGRKLFPRMSVLENLEIGAYRRSMTKATLRGELDKVYTYFPILEERSRQEAGSMSGGEQQMLAMARGLMAGPKVLLLDEPSLGLAPLMVEEIARIIKEINQAGVTILLVEQNAEMALNEAHYGFVLETGRISLQGPAKELLESEKIRHAYLGV